METMKMVVQLMVVVPLMVLVWAQVVDGVTVEGIKAAWLSVMRYSIGKSLTIGDLVTMAGLWLMGVSVTGMAVLVVIR